MCARAGVSSDDLLRNNGVWVSLEQFESVLASVRDQVDSDEAFVDACAYRIKEAYGPFRFLLWATSPGAVLSLAARTLHIMSSVSRGEVLERKRTRIRLRYTGSRPESRLICLSRQGATAALPTLWGLPRADLVETACVANGDACCEYEVHWADRPRWLASLIGAAAGFAVTMALAAAHLLPVVTSLALPIVGALAGYVLELRRAGRANLEMREEHGQAARLFAAAEAETRRELLALNTRQAEWTRILEESAVERTRAMRRVVDQLTHDQAERDVTLRGVSHDLKHPLVVLKANISALRAHFEWSADRREEALADVEAATDEMTRLLEALVKTAFDREIVNLLPTRVEVEPLVEKLRRRLQALVYGRNIRVSVFRTREAPDAITTDPLLLDRLVDNLLINAAKYTDRGSIIIEITGAPRMMTIKFSDTGRGMQPEDLSRSFRPRGADEHARSGDSYGMGLSVVVQLLEQVGGQLEVMSKPDHGTTFWLHLPLAAPLRLVSPPPPAEGTVEERYEKLLSKVVNIRLTGGSK